MLPANLGEASKIAEYIAASNLFGCKTKEQAFALMLLADAEGLHPAAAARDYHIVDGKPSLKADAMLARYMGAGGKIKWIERSETKVSAEFTHPSSGSVTITWDQSRATTANLWAKKNWKSHPQQMLSARVISEGVRASFPGVVSGVYTPEEVGDFDDVPAPRRQAEPAATEATFEPTDAVSSDAPSKDQQAAGAAARDAAPVQTMSKADSRADYAALEYEMRACKTAAELIAWGKLNLKRIQLQAPSFQTELRKEGASLLAGLRHMERAASEADEYAQELAS
jgi:hypothetical protein